MHKRALNIFILLIAMLPLRAADSLNFIQVERQSLELYNASRWKELVHFGNEAFKYGIDYYYLRMRVGTGYYEMSRYVQAAYNFEKALEFNSDDPAAMEYLYYCFLETNNKEASRKIYKKAPPGLQKKIKATGLPGMNTFNLEGGPSFSDQEKLLDEKWFKANNQLYTETDVIGDGYYVNTGLHLQLSPAIKTFLAYSMVTQDRSKLIHINDAITKEDYDDQYKMKQNQFYLNLNFNLGKGFSLVPAFHYVKTSFTTIQANFDNMSERYTITNLNYSDNQYIAYLSLSKDFRILSTSVFFAKANLNNDKQAQAGFRLTYYPFGNLNLYSVSTLMNHYALEKNRIVFDQMLGIRLLKPIWIEFSATFGELHNFFERNAFIVYNIPDQINFKAGSRLIWTISKNWMITLDYLYLSRESSIYSYQLPDNQTESIIKTIKQTAFTNQFILGGIQWTF